MTVAGDAFQELTIVIDKPAEKRLQDFGEISLRHPEPGIERIRLILEDADLERDQAESQNHVEITD